MTLDPVVAAMLGALPPQPGIRSMDIASYRAAVRAMSAQAPKADIPIGDVRDRTIDAGGVPPLNVRIYTPAGEEPFPLLVYYHGGGFAIGDLDTSDATCRTLAKDVGCVVLSVDYRLAPEHPWPTPNEDCWAALRWAQDNAAALGADPARIAVGGDSAGSTLAAWVALHARDAGLPLVAQLLMCGVQDFDTGRESYRTHADAPLISLEDIVYYYEQYLPAGIDRASPDVAPLHAASLAGLPPAFVMTAEIDPSRDGGEAYAAALAQAGVPVVAKRYPGMPHGFYALAAYVPAARAAMDDVASWLRPRFA